MPTRKIFSRGYKKPSRKPKLRTIIEGENESRTPSPKSNEDSDAILITRKRSFKSPRPKTPSPPTKKNQSSVFSSIRSFFRTTRKRKPSNRL